MRKPILAIVGRPNVGKSSLLNRIVGKRAAVVDDEPGVTRDRNYVETQWDGFEFLMTDTGGVLPPSADTMAGEIRAQVETAVAEADAIVFVVDVTCPPTDLDLYLARYLHRAAPGRVVVAANKAERPLAADELTAYMQLGLGEPLPVSALHGRGIAALLERVKGLLAERTGPGRDEGPEGTRIAILGRPNAGKSSLVNRLLGARRMIVHDAPGTTRDAIDTRLAYHGKAVVLIDTAGLRKKSHVHNRIEYYSNLRALDSIGRSDVCVLVVDASQGVAEQDVRILQLIEEQGRGMVLCLNKWDLVQKDHRTFDGTVKDLRRRYMQLKYVPVLSVSALTGQRVPQIIDTALAIGERMRTHVPQGRLRTLLREWTLRNPHPLVSGKPVHMLGGKQIDSGHPVFLVFAGNHKLVKPSYERYLVNCIQEEFGFLGCPVTVAFRPPAAPGRGRGRVAAAQMVESEGDEA